VDGVNRLERLHALTEHLRRAAPQPTSAATLAHRFGVSRRTIERDLAALRRAGVALYAEHGRTGGQVSVDRPATTVATLSAAEVSALLVALAAAGPTMPFADAGRSAADRLVDSLSPAARLAAEQLRDRIRVREHPPTPRRAARTVVEALRRQVVVNLDYIDGSGRATTRSVDPVGYLNGTDAWCLIGWCHLRQGGRLFRLDRVAGARLTTRSAGSHDLDETLGWIPDEVTTP
jgi:proteasome accessory factor B